jgi:tetratricopeptide (TPR) repeat protein
MAPAAAYFPGMDLFGPVHRTQMSEKYQASLLDLVFLHFQCKSCKKPIFDSTIRTIAGVDYRSPEALVEQAKKILKASKGTQISCDCGKSATVSAGSYHAYHSGRQADLVVRFEYGLFGVSGPSFLWWTQKDGYRDATLDEKDVKTFQRDAAVRSIAVVRETQGIEAAFPQIEAALAAIPGDKALLDLVPRLLGVGKNSLAGQIIDAHRRLHPDDPDGHALDGELTFRLMNEQLWDKSHMPEAEASLNQALSLSPDHLPAQLTQAGLARLREDEAGARAIYERILRTHPECDIPYYNLGVMLLDEEPARALEHFQGGERVAPEDADYPIGCARALVKLGRKAEAQAALERGVKLAPKHPRIAEVRAALSA